MVTIFIACFYSDSTKKEHVLICILKVVPGYVEMCRNSHLWVVFYGQKLLYDCWRWEEAKRLGNRHSCMMEEGNSPLILGLKNGHSGHLYRQGLGYYEFGPRPCILQPHQRSWLAGDLETPIPRSDNTLHLYQLFFHYLPQQIHLLPIPPFADSIYAIPFHRGFFSFPPNHHHSISSI